MTFADIVEFPLVLLSELTAANAYPPGRFAVAVDQSYALYRSNGTSWGLAVTGVLSEFNVLDYGATGRETVDHVGIQSALDAAAATVVSNARGGIVRARPGIYLLNAQVVIPNMTVLRGDGRQATIFKAGPSFPINTPLFRLGDGSDLTFCNRLEECQVDCNDVAGSTGIYSSSINERGGVRGVFLRKYRAYGLHVDNAVPAFPPGNCSFREIELDHSASGATADMFLNGVTGVNWLEDITANSSVNIADGIKLANTAVAGGRIHVEDATDAIEFGAGATGSLIGVDGGTTTTNLIHVLSTNGGGIALAGLTPNSATTTVLDDLHTQTLTGNMASWQVGATGAGASKPLWHLSAAPRKIPVEGIAFGDDTLLERPAASTLRATDTIFQVSRGTAASVAYSALVTGDSPSRYVVLADGTVEWGPGNATRDVALSRVAADLLGLAAGDGMQFGEAASDFSAPAADKVKVYARDNGGKTELVARFPTGAIQQLAIEP